MSFESISKEYLIDVERLLNSEGYQNEATPELSYRPALNQFLENLARFFNPQIESIFEPRSQARSGRPDWRFHNRNHLGIYGYIEAKGINPTQTIIPIAHQAQVQKYLSLGHKIILTDGIDFTFYNDNSAENISLIRKPFGRSINMETINIALEEKFRSFFSDAGFRECSESELIEGVALRCKRLSDGIRDLLEIPEGSGLTEQENITISSLRRLYENLQLKHDSRLSSEKSFSDFVAQVLSFGLLLAHRLLKPENVEPIEVRDHLERFWSDDYFNHFTNELSPFKELSLNLRNELAQLGSVGTWYQDTIYYLSHVRLHSTQIERPSYHILFERFLAKFDPETRFNFGAFYTPKELADFTVILSEMIAHKYFETSIFTTGNKIIDPCCGTGTFLESLILLKPQDAKPLLIGLEILPGPYALAKYRLNFLGVDEENIPTKIFLTNTLSDVINRNSIEESPNELDPFIRERNLVRIHSRQPIMLVIGNPPSSDSGEEDNNVSTEILDSLLEDFRPSENERSGRQNIQKQISNPFMKFLRWSFDKTVQSRRGICSLIVPSTFLKNRSYFWARKYLKENCSAIYVLDIDKDLRAVNSSNLFNVQQGRSLLICVHNSSIQENGVFYKSILDLTRSEKIAFLNSGTSSLDCFQELEINENFKFSPSVLNENIFSDSVLINLYPSSPADISIFKRTCNGLKLSPTTFFIHKRSEILLRRLIEFKRGTAETLSLLLTKWFQGQIKGPKAEKLTPEVLSSIPNANNINSKVFKYSFRPFLELNAFIDENVFQVLARTAGGGARIRPEIMATVSRLGTFKGLSIAPAPSELGENLKPFATYCWGIPDNDLCSRGNSKILSVHFPEYKTRANWDSTPKLNLDQSVLTKILSLYEGLDDVYLLENISFYLLAILRSTFYLNNFSNKLFGVAGESIPPIFFPKNKDIFIELATLGKLLAELESPLYRNSLQPLGVLNITKSTFRFTDFKVERENGLIKLFEDRVLAVTISSISTNIMDFELSGYTVLDTFLKFNKFAYTNTSLDTTGIDEIRKLISSISLSLEKTTEIDAHLESFSDDDLIVFH